jgi:GMP synthase (glutamine-hydrolysing)
MRDVNAFIEKSVAEIKEKIPEPKKAIIAVSGGVDSTTAAALCDKAIGDRLVAIHVDTGVMRKDESREVVEILKKIGINVKLVDAKEQFYEDLKGVTDPEDKRKVIGERFIRVFEEEAEKVEGAEFLIQGTIAPDWIESGKGKGGVTGVIKSHHNVGGLPEEMNLSLVEPLRDLYKDEVRVLAEALDVPKELYEKQPFPGPGLAVRLPGEVTPEKVKILQEADAIYREELDKAVAEGKCNRPWQYFAVLLPVKTVGVQGDVRAYGYTIGLRAVESFDGMTANFLQIPGEVLQKMSTRITNELKEHVNRVVYDITNKPPSTIEWE